MNTHEQYISLETAKLLKKVGFDWECRAYYFYLINDPNPRFYHAENFNNFNKWGPDAFSAPTKAVVMKWLREVKGLNIGINCLYDTINEMIIYSSTITSLQNDNYFRHRLYCEDTYEQAAETAIKEALKILNEQQQ